jgi:hypothetical protein
LQKAEIDRRSEVQGVVHLIPTTIRSAVRHTFL